jgi:hypothetical protein
MRILTLIVAAHERWARLRFSVIGQLCGRVIARGTIIGSSNEAYLLFLEALR